VSRRVRPEKINEIKRTDTPQYQHGRYGAPRTRRWRRGGKAVRCAMVC